MPRLETITLGIETAEIQQLYVQNDVEETLNPYRIHPGLLRFTRAQAEGGYGEVWKVNMSLIAANQLPDGARGEVQGSGEAESWFPTTGQNGEPLTRHIVLGELAVAVKKLKILDNMTAVQKLDIKRRFAREMLVWSRLNHPNVTRFLGFHLDLDNADAWLVSPWNQHGNLESYLKTHSLSNLHIMVILENVASGLNYLHHQQPPIVHGDLKPANVLMTASRNCRLCDFGLARILDAEDAKTTAEFRGSLPWASPEVLGGSRPRAPADVWAWGVLAYQVSSSGRLPFFSENLSMESYGARVANGRLLDALPSLNRLRPILVPLLTLCWNTKESDRPEIMYCHNRIQQGSSVLLQIRTAVWCELIPRLAQAWYVSYGLLAWESCLIAMNVHPSSPPFQIPNNGGLAVFLIMAPVGAFISLHVKRSLQWIKAAAVEKSQIEINEASATWFWVGSKSPVNLIVLIAALVVINETIGVLAYMDYNGVDIADLHPCKCGLEIGDNVAK